MTHLVQVLATVLFAAAIAHTFSARRFRDLSRDFEAGSYRANVLGLLGEVEVVFGIWAALLVLLLAAIEGPERAVAYLVRVDFSQAVFVFAIMIVAATRPIRRLAGKGIGMTAGFLSRFVPGLTEPEAFFIATLVLGPLLGSLITEPAAMAVSALILRDRFFGSGVSTRFKYKTLALLFVNISIGGLLTHFAAPPVVMVTKIWQWDTPYMFRTFGYKAAVAVVVNTIATFWMLRPEFAKIGKVAESPVKTPTADWVVAVHVLFIFLFVYVGHQAPAVLAVLLLFLGFARISARDQDPLQIRDAALVGFFLAGILLIGKPQTWWIAPLITSLSRLPLYFGTTVLTAFTDNAALTTLGGQVPFLADPLKYALVAGAVTGGGLTVIANAPNPAGYSILKEYFGDEGVRPARLFRAALIPTVIASICLLLL